MPNPDFPGKQKLLLLFMRWSDVNDTRGRGARGCAIQNEQANDSEKRKGRSGRGGLPAKHQRQVRAWLDNNRDFALRKWREIAEA